jgi:hypothetical protein|tara:strand:- start:538 stop:1197 length:660 start_codon:yes stop_codon:yes gene_type:complete
MMVMDDNELKVTFRAWVVYQGMNAHFTRTSNYDYFEYNGKGNWNSIDSMEKSFTKLEKNGNFSLQRKIFKDIGKTFTSKEDLIFFYLSQFSNGIEYPSHFDSDLYDEYKERMNNFNFHIQQDIGEILKCMREYKKSFDEIFITNSMNHPYILKLSLSNRISLETFAVLDMILDFIPEVDKYLKDPIWKDRKRMVLKYKPFLEVDIVKQKKIIMDVLMKG